MPSSLFLEGQIIVLDRCVLDCTRICPTNASLVVEQFLLKLTGLEEIIDAVYGDGFDLPTLLSRLLTGFHYLKYTSNESNKSAVNHWVENPYRKYFCAYKQLQHKLPLCPSTLVKWYCNPLEKILSVAIDTTTHEKVIAFPIDAKLYHKVRMMLVREAHKRHINLKQCFKKAQTNPSTYMVIMPTKNKWNAPHKHYTKDETPYSNWKLSDTFNPTTN